MDGLLLHGEPCEPREPGEPTEPPQLAGHLGRRSAVQATPIVLLLCKSRLQQIIATHWVSFTIGEGRLCVTRVVLKYVESVGYTSAKSSAHSVAKLRTARGCVETCAGFRVARLQPRLIECKAGAAIYGDLQKLDALLEFFVAWPSRHAPCGRQA